MTIVIVVGGPASRELAKKIADALNVPYLELEHKLFPDGESYIRYPIERADIRGENVVIVQSLYKPQDKHLIELLFAIDAARALGAEKVVAVAPYLAYARQDKVFRPGENVSVMTVFKLIKGLGADCLITVDIHNERSIEEAPIKAFNVTAVPVLAKYAVSLGLENPLVLAPDKGALWRAKLAASIIGAEYDYLEKRRDRITGEITVKPKELSVEGRDVVIIDDIISTGGTIALAASEAKKNGAKKVIALCTHAVLAPGAIEKMEKGGVDHVASTDTIPSPITKVTVADVIADKLKEIGVL